MKENFLKIKFIIKINLKKMNRTYQENKHKAFREISDPSNVNKDQYMKSKEKENKI